MSVYKEFFHAIGLIEQKTEKIYPDAADMGALTKKDDELWKWATQLVEWYGKKESRQTVVYATGTTVTNIVEGIEEWRTGDEIHYKITYVSVKGGIKRPNHIFDGYLQVELVKTIKNKGRKPCDF